MSSLNPKSTSPTPDESPNFVGARFNEDGVKKSSRKLPIGKPQRIFISSIVWKRSMIIRKR
jgi:hypothetical protein